MMRNGTTKTKIQIKKNGDQYLIQAVTGGTVRTLAERSNYPDALDLAASMRISLKWNRK